MKIINCEQGTPEWFKARDEKMTASHATAIGNSGKGLDTYIKKMMSEHYSSKEKEQYTNKDLERGNELEPLARQVYELETGNTVEQVGFIEYSKYVGCSPDGLIDDGGIEIKCPDDSEYFEYLLEGADAIPSGYIWQMQMCMLITGKRFWDFIAYNPNFKKSICIFRIYPDLEKFEKLKKGFEVGETLIKVIKKTIEK